MKKLMKGNEAIAEAAIQAGCRFFFGYPITPQNQIPEYMSKRMPQVNGCFLQAESEVAAINMVYGAGGAGARVMTSSSSPGISLKQEGISYLVGAEVPCVIVNMVRGGPGLGSIQPAQSDYYQSTRGGGHGDYRMCVLAPSSVQEAVDLTQDAFDIADRYRNPVLVLGDGLIGQMMEPVDMDRASTYQQAEGLPPKTWAASGHVPTQEAPRAIINSLFIDPQVLEAHGLALQAKYDQIAAQECRWQEELLEDAQIVIIAYGTTSRIARSAMRRCRARGIKVGMIRPITLWPFPEEAIRKTIPAASAYLVVEMSMGQMVDDVRLAINGERPVHFYGRTGGMVPTVAEVTAQIEKLAGVEPIPPEVCKVDIERTLNDAAQKADEVAKAMSNQFEKMGKSIDNALKNAALREKAEAAANQVDAAVGAMGQKIHEAGQKLNDALNSPELTQKAEEAAQKAEEWANTLGEKLSSAFEGSAGKPEEAPQAANEAAPAAAPQAVEQPADTEEAADGQATEKSDSAADTASDKVQEAFAAIGSKMDAAGKKLGDALESGELQHKAEEAAKQAGAFATNAAQTVKKGAGSLLGAIGKLFAGVKKDLRDIEAEQTAKAKPEDSSGKEGDD